MKSINTNFPNNTLFGEQILRDVAKKKRENVGIFPKSGTPLPPFGNVMFFRRKKLWFILHCRTLETFIVGWFLMLKTVKNGSGIRVDPPPVFSKFPHFPVFVGGA